MTFFHFLDTLGTCEQSIKHCYTSLSRKCQYCVSDKTVAAGITHCQYDRRLYCYIESSDVLNTAQLNLLRVTDM